MRKNEQTGDRPLPRVIPPWWLNPRRAPTSLPRRREIRYGEDVSEDHQPASDAELLAELPIFPLPNSVLFPGVVLPLHLFEERYRALAEHCVAGNRLMGLATLKSGYEDNYDGRPPIHLEMGLGKIVADKRLDDGRWNIALYGLARIRVIEELPADAPFRKVAAEVVYDVDESGDEELARQIYSLLPKIVGVVAGVGRHVTALLEQRPEPGRLADMTAALVVEDVDLRRRLVAEANVSARLEHVITALANVAFGQIPDDQLH